MVQNCIYCCKYQNEWYSKCLCYFDIYNLSSGRKYIQEFKNKDNSVAHYVCDLCEVTCSWKSVADHVMGYKHRLKCMVSTLCTVKYPFNSNV